MNVIYILVTVDADSYMGRHYDTGYYRTEAAALDAVRLTEDERELYRRPTSGFSYADQRTTIHDFAYFRIDRVELLD